MLPASAVPALIGHFPTGDAGDEAREIGGFGGHGLHGESIAQHGLHQIVSIVEETTAPQVSAQRRPSRWLRDVLAQGAVSLCGQPEVDSSMFSLSSELSNRDRSTSPSTHFTPGYRNASRISGSASAPKSACPAFATMRNCTGIPAACQRAAISRVGR